jgi:hypothetical protein
MRLKQLIVIILVIIILYYTCVKKTDGFVDAGRCGVDLPPCSSGLRCINGYCKSDIAPVLPYFSDLPITPDRH